ncbi:hypothetical protein JCM30760_21260 [Thiomicrorhabdus hydrogeniphila]
MLEITSIDTVTEQGQTQPLVCKADDGDFYFVKYLRGATANGLVKEWIFAQMARDFGFNTPDFTAAFLCQPLIDAFPHFAKHGVVRPPEEGVVFASKKVDYCEDFSMSNLYSVSIEKQQDLLVFDLWIRNDDRNLSNQGGNVNLLWSVSENDFYVFDHNLAFDESEDKFLETHVFRESAGQDYNFDMVLRQNYEQKLQTILQKWDNYISACPPDWLEADDFTLDLEYMKRTLLSDAQGQIWERLR